MSYEEDLKKMYEHLEKLKKLAYVYHVLNFDLETKCPVKNMNCASDSLNVISSQIFDLTHEKEYIDLVVSLHEKRDEAKDDYEKTLIDNLYKSYIREKNVSKELDDLASKVYSNSYIDWLKAKKNKDYSLFEPSLEKVKEIQQKLIDTREDKKDNYYDTAFSDYERGLTSKDLDKLFGELRDGIVNLLNRIKKSKHKIRTDFMSREVPIEKQEQFSNYILETMGFDFSRGCIATTEHPFTDTLSKDDTRVTTHYYLNQFVSNIFTIAHEGGHALFGQNQDDEDFNHYIDDSMTLGMHESVSRFYENILGRSKAFIHLIYPKFKEIFGDIFFDVSEEELYEAVNEVKPSLIRTEADELTYSLHIIIRYEIEKDIINNKVDLKDIKALWNKKYEEYLGVTPTNDSEGILQDVHWSSGFGYFPTYALGNIYNAMYYNSMKEKLDVDKLIRENKMDVILKYMTENVFKDANKLDSKTWIKKITNKDIDSSYFLKYLEDKYVELYRLEK